MKSKNKSKKIHKLFTEFLYTTKLKDINNEELLKVAYSMKNKEGFTENQPDWSSNTLSTMNYPLNEAEDPTGVIKATMDSIAKEVIEFTSEFDVPPGAHIQVTGGWFNFAAPGDFQEQHTHAHANLSAVYYIKLPPNSGYTSFRKPYTSMMQLPSTTGTNCAEHFLLDSVEESDLVIFESYLPHMAEVNRSEEERVTMGMNFWIVEPEGGM